MPICRSNQLKTKSTIGGGLSLEVGVVNDHAGSSALYFTFGGNSGLGGGYGGKGGVITPTAGNPFSVDDFAGKGSSWSAGIDSPLLARASRSWTQRGSMKIKT